MTESKSEKVTINMEAFRKMSREDHAEICTMIMRKLVEKASELEDLYRTLLTTYKEEMLITGISVVCAISSEAFDKDDPPIQIILGSPEGVMHTAMPLVKVLNEKVVPFLGDVHESDEAAG